MKTNKDLMVEIHAALAAVPELTDCLSDIYILANDGSVIVSGQVNSPRHGDLINEIIRGVAGVNQLIDEIKVQQNIKHRVGVEIDWNAGHMEIH
ncbi:BON domain-containing protein [Chryseolinea lacunae]|uniref:BON domain-containing protein n=1 Tax=Chryseolinea lacunae TaxID=2801331 RepID=A0ABS1KUC8_9BACT|nr:BON domain-containing protein [Chryseolinea lacunae]MBL0743019.1 BON domain-containing protein [Chryseolinea lacunae]